MMSTTELANIINEQCKSHKYFWAIGLIKDTIKVWENSKRFAMLNGTARIIAGHYLKEANTP